MPIKNYSTTPGNNTSAPPFGAPESSTKLKDFNDLARQIMADVRCLAAPATIASAATTDLGASDETIQTISGTTTITSFGTVSAGIYKFVTFSGALTLTHNATSLILLGGTNRTTVAGDCGLYVSLGSGNWKEYFYSPISAYQPLDPTLTALAGSLTAANKIPYATATDVLGELTRTIDGTLAGNSDANIPTEKAVKTYVDTVGSGANFGTFAVPATTGNYVITGVGFKPRHIRITCSNMPGASGTTFTLGLGFATSATSRAAFSVVHNGVGSTLLTNKVIQAVNTAGLAVVQADLVSMDADGFTLNFTGVDTSYTVIWEAFR